MLCWYLALSLSTCANLIADTVSKGMCGIELDWPDARKRFVVLVPVTGWLAARIMLCYVKLFDFFYCFSVRPDIFNDALLVIII